MLETVKNASVHQVPKSLEDCVKQDPVSKALWQWAERVATLGIILMIWFVVSSVIEGFVMASGNYDNQAIIFLVSVAKGVMAACITYVSYHVVSLLIASLASIVQHTRSTALLKEFELGGGEYKTSQKTTTSTSRASTADSTSRASAADSSKLLGNHWNCCKCWSKNPASATVCSKCGNPRR